MSTIPTPAGSQIIFSPSVICTDCDTRHASVISRTSAYTRSPGVVVPPEIAPLVAGSVSTKAIADHWQDILRLVTSIRTGAVNASVILRKLAAYPRQNGLAHALRELGKLERTIFTLDWMQDPDLRRRSHVGLNKGEQQNALRRAVFFNRLGEIRDRSLRKPALLRERPEFGRRRHHPLEYDLPTACR
jgi:TnpA family transposase